MMNDQQIFNCNKIENLTMGVLSIDGPSTSSSAPNFTCQKCGCACASRVKDTFCKYNRESQLFFSQIDNPCQSIDATQGNRHHFQQQQQQQPYPSTTPNTTSFQDFHHRHHHATTTANLDLQHQVESLKARLKRTSEHVEKLEHSLFEVRQQAEQDARKYQTESKSSRDKYERLLESHKQMQRVNQMLEDKIIAAADQADAEKTKLRSAVVALSTQLKSSSAHVQALECVNEGLRRDCSVAVRLLQCRSSTFLTHRLDDLPPGLRDRVKANLSYEEIKCVEAARKSEDGGGFGGLWNMFSVPSSLFVSTFPPSAAFFNEEKDDGNAERKNPDSVMIDMSEAEDAAGNIPTSVLARAFDADSQTSTRVTSLPACSSGDKLHSSPSMPSLTPQQENLLMLYGSDPSSPSMLKPDIFPCSSSSSSTSDANEVTLQYYKCRRCRLQCVTCDKWTQTPLAPIYGGSGTAPALKEEEESSPASLLVHLQGWRSGGNANLPTSSSSPQSAGRSAFQSFPVSSFHESVTTATADASRGQLPHAYTFPHLGLGAFPDLVASAEMTTARARMVSSSSSSSSCTIQSQTDSRPANVCPGGLAATGMPHDEGTFNESHRRRNDSEAGSVSGWGDIHFGDTTNSNNVSHSDVVLDISSDAVNTHVAQMVDSSTTMLSTCMEEIALDDGI